MEEQMGGLLAILVLIGAAASPAHAWDHPGHMTTADIEFIEIERMRPDLVDKIGLLLLRGPDSAPFWVAAGDAKGMERTRRMFIEGARWPDDATWTCYDQPTWHSARWPVIAKVAPPEAKAAAEARSAYPAGQEKLRALYLKK